MATHGYEVRVDPVRITTSGEMREIDRIADQEFGLDASILMENAGRAAAQLIAERYPNAGRASEILVFAGKGNNAGDAFVVARRLMCLERRVRVFHLRPESGYAGSTKKNFQILSRMKAKMTFLENIEDLHEFFRSSPGPFTVVDGILGTGLKGDLSGILYDVVESINSLQAQEVIALDIPTGVSGDTGSILSTSIMASMTISFGFPKLGHFLPPGASRRGELINVDISLPPKFKRGGDKYLLTKAPMAALLKERDRYGHKNSFGHTLLIGGCPGKVGAIALAARACHKMGTGLVTAATWDDAFGMLVEKLHCETMALPIRATPADFDQYEKRLGDYSSAVIGPGLGSRPEGKDLVRETLLRFQGPLVVDADALNIIAEHRLHDFLVRRRDPVVLTPHPGEMARLLGVSKEEVTADPARAVKEAVAKTHSVVVLKGAATLIGSPEDVLFLNHYPNDGMATAGSGDVLAGMIGGLLGQGMDAFQAARLGIFLHSLAGDFAAKAFGHRSMTSADIIENISHAFKEIKNPGPETPPHVEGRTRLL